jgi:hypothetical protein
MKTGIRGPRGIRGSRREAHRTGGNAEREVVKTWWRINPSQETIEPVKVATFTKSFVNILENQECNKQKPPIWKLVRANRLDIFPSFDAAKFEAVLRAATQVEIAENNLQQKRYALDQWRSLAEPGQDKERHP